MHYASSAYHSRVRPSASRYVIYMWHIFMVSCIYVLVSSHASAATLAQETALMRNIRTNIELEISDKTCISDSDCGAAILLSGGGCRMYTPFSLAHANEYKMQALLQAYNGLSLRSARDNGQASQPCRYNTSEPDPSCKRAKHQRTGTCILS